MTQGDFSIRGGWLYLSFTLNLSVGYAFYCLGMFYYVLKTPLTPYDPVPKFLCIKAVLFLSFWQVWMGCFRLSNFMRAAMKQIFDLLLPPAGVRLRCAPY